MWCLIAGDTTTLTFKKTIRHNAAVVVFWTCLFRSWPHGDNTGSFCLCECKPCVILTAPLMERGPQQGAGRWLVATGHGSHINEGESHGGRAGMHGAPLTLHLIIYTHDESIMSHELTGCQRKMKKCCDHRSIMGVAQNDPTYDIIHFEPQWRYSVVRLKHT